MERLINKVLARQTINAMVLMVEALKVLDAETMHKNPYRCAFLMEGPISTIEDLIRDLKTALCQENSDNDE